MVKFVCRCDGNADADAINNINPNISIKYRVRVSIPKRQCHLKHIRVREATTFDLVSNMVIA